MILNEINQNFKKNSLLQLISRNLPFFIKYLYKTAQKTYGNEVIAINGCSPQEEDDVIYNILGDQYPFTFFERNREIEIKFSNNSELYINFLENNGDFRVFINLNGESRSNFIFDPTSTTFLEFSEKYEKQIKNILSIENYKYKEEYFTDYFFKSEEKIFKNKSLRLNFEKSSREKEEYRLSITSSMDRDVPYLRTTSSFISDSLFKFQIMYLRKSFIHLLNKLRKHNLYVSSSTIKKDGIYITLNNKDEKKESETLKELESLYNDPNLNKLYEISIRDVFSK